MSRPDTPSNTHSALLARVDYAEQVQEVTNRIHAASNIDELLISLSNDILGLFDAKHLTLYAVDQTNNELYSRFLDTNKIHEIRVPIGTGSIEAAIFTATDEEKVKEIATTPGIALHNQYQRIPRYTKFGALIATQRLTQEQLEEATTTAHAEGTPVESILMEQFSVTKREIGRALSEFYRYPFLVASKHLDVAPDLIQGVSPSYLQANYWLPLRATDDVS